MVYLVKCPVLPDHVYYRPAIMQNGELKRLGTREDEPEQRHISSPPIQTSDVSSNAIDMLDQICSEIYGSENHVYDEQDHHCTYENFLHYHEVNHHNPPGPDTQPQI